MQSNMQNKSMKSNDKRPLPSTCLQAGGWALLWGARLWAAGDGASGQQKGGSLSKYARSQSRGMGGGLRLVGSWGVESYLWLPSLPGQSSRAGDIYRVLG